MNLAGPEALNPYELFGGTKYYYKEEEIMD